ncbi:MAG: hypothetical protein QM770_11530 [Tepidisphaeraceae bacterium]
MVALRVASNSGIAVPQKVMDGAVKYVRSCYSERGGGFTYQGHGNDVGFARTAAATYSLQVCGLYDDALVNAGMKFMDARFDRDENHWTYGNFYAAPAHYMRGGKDWSDWYRRVNARLMRVVKRDIDQAHWDPTDPGAQQAGAIYATSVYVSILALPYGSLPIYQR